jgi:hypothetical protein
LALADVDPTLPLPTMTPAPGSPMRSPIAPGFTGGNHAVQRRARVALRVGAYSDPRYLACKRRHIVDRDAAGWRGDLAAERRSIELGDRACAAATASHVVPEAFPPDAERRDDADSADNDLGTAGVAHDRSYNR